MTKQEDTDAQLIADVEVKREVAAPVAAKKPAAKKTPRKKKPVDPNAPPKPKGRPPGSKDKKKRKFTRDHIPDPKKLMTEALDRSMGMNGDEVVQRARELEAERKEKGVSGTRLEIMSRHAEECVMVYKLQIRGLRPAQIAQQMGVNETRVKSLLEDLRNQLRLDPKKLDVGHYMGETLAFYEEVRQMALLQTASDKATPGTKLAAMQTAMMAEQQKNQFLSKIGVYSEEVVQRIERWVVSHTDHHVARPPAEVPRVNLALEVGRVLSKRRAA